MRSWKGWWQEQLEGLNVQARELEATMMARAAARSEKTRKGRAAGPALRGPECRREESPDR
jgi:hypothetical protein